MYTEYEESLAVNGSQEDRQSESKKVIELHVTRERMQTIAVGDYLEFEDNPRSTRAQITLLSNFVSDGNGHFLDKKEAMAAIKKLTFPQLTQAMTEVASLIRGTAVPNE